MTEKDLNLIQRYLATTSNRLRLVDERLDKEILTQEDLNPTGMLESIQGESSYLDVIDLQVRSIKNLTETVLWKVQSLQEKK